MASGLYSSYLRGSDGAGTVVHEASKTNTNPQSTFVALTIIDVERPIIGTTDTHKCTGKGKGKVLAYSLRALRPELIQVWCTGLQVT